MFAAHLGGVAQLGEHLLCKQGVIGSNPIVSTKQGSRLGSAQTDQGPSPWTS